jgi:uncharacterized membrane protein YfcA
MKRAMGCRFFRRAVGWSIPIGGLGGLIGLGGGEFRLPVLMYGIGFDAKAAVPLNLVVSFVTLAFALITRSQAVSLSAVVPHGAALLGLAAGGMASAFWGARVVQALSLRRLVQLIALLLAALGGLLLFEAVAPFQQAALLPPGAPIHFVAGAVIGIGVGLVSAVLGVAGGELLIPALIFLFGVDIKTAGTASILISLGVVLTGLWRYWRLDAIPHGGGARRITVAMSVGSIAGATLGGLAVAVAPVMVLKLLLGAVLIAAAVKTTLSASRGAGRASP